MAKETKIEIPVTHTYDRDLDINICKVQVSPVFRDLLATFIITEPPYIGFTQTVNTVEGGMTKVAKHRHRIKTVLFNQSDISQLNQKELMLGAFYDVETWDKKGDVIFNISNLKEYYDLTSELKLFFQGILNAVAATRINITHTFVASIKEE